MLLNKKNKANAKETNAKDLVNFEVTDQLCEHFYMLHQSCLKIGATPRLYLAFLQNYVNMYSEKRSGIEKRRGHLQVSVTLNLTLDLENSSSIKISLFYFEVDWSLLRSTSLNLNP